MNADTNSFRATGSAYDRPEPFFDADLAKVGRGTKMGELLRRYWHPVYKSDKLTDMPVQVRALGEDIVLFRKPSGEVGAVYPRCVHRGASLFYGKVTDRGIRCPYHAWTFEPDGHCTDQPCEPNGGAGRGAVRQPWYPVEERYGLIFVYQGPLHKKPQLPRYDVLENLPDGWEIVADDTTIPSGGAGHMPCNWLQHHENGQDPYHVAIVHKDQFPPIMAEAESTYHFEALDDRVNGRGISKIGPMMLDFRVELIMPTVRVIPTPLLNNPRPDGKGDNVAWTVPKDDTDTIVFTAISQPIGVVAEFNGELYNGKRWADLTPEEHQRYPGDFETQVSQGPITFHSEEHLTGGDRGIVFLRRMLQAGAAAVAEGRDPPLAFGAEDIFIHTTAGITMGANPDYIEPEATPDAAPQAAPTGTRTEEHWQLSMATPMGEQKLALKLVRDGAALSGTMTGAEGENPLKDAKADGNTLHFAVAVKSPMSMTITFDVTIEGNTLTGKFKPGMFPSGKVTGVRE